MFSLLSWLGPAKPYLLIGSIGLAVLGGFLLGGRLEALNTAGVQREYDLYRLEAAERQIEEDAHAAQRLRELADNQSKLIKAAEERESQLRETSDILIEELRKSKENSPLSQAVRDYVDSIKQLQEERDRL